MFRVLLFAKMCSEQRDSCYSMILQLNSNSAKAVMEWTALTEYKGPKVTFLDYLAKSLPYIKADKFCLI
jgi:hypothetical protein